MKKILFIAFAILAFLHTKAQKDIPKDTAYYSTKDGQLEVVKTTVQVVTYSYDNLLKQKAAIEDQKQKEMAQRDAEIAEIDVLIEEAKKGGIDQAIEAQPSEIKP